MAHRQIQYSPIAEPPAFTPPTTDALGWRPSAPDSAQPFSSRREYQTRGGGSRACYDTQSHAVFAVEQWAIPLGAGAEFPDRPHLTINRRDLRLRGGGYAALYDTQSHAVFALEQWTTPKGVLFEGPDNPQSFINPREYRLKGGGYRAALDPALMPMDLTQPVAASVTWAPCELPDDPRLGRRLGVAWPVYPQTEFGVEVDVPVESWEACFPDLPPFSRPVRALLMPSTVSAFTQTAATVTFTQVELPDDGRLGRRLQLTTAAMLASVSDGWSGLEQRAPTLLWSVAYPDRTRRASLSSSAVPSVFRTEAFEQWARLASTTYPDRVVRALRLSEYPAVSQAPQPIAAAPVPVGWPPALVDSTRLATRLPVYPPLTLTLALEQLASPPLAWQPRLVERAVRANAVVVYPAVSYNPGVVVVVAPTLSWAPSKSERPVRVLRLLEYPALSLSIGFLSDSGPERVFVRGIATISQTLRAAAPVTQQYARISPLTQQLSRFGRIP